MTTEIQNKLKNISMATSYLAQYVSQNVSLKTALKDISVQILNYTYFLKDIYNLKAQKENERSNKSEKEMMVDIKSILQGAIDLVDLGRVDDSISSMNARVYNQGLFSFMEALQEKDFIIENQVNKASQEEQIINEGLIDLLGDKEYIEKISQKASYNAKDKIEEKGEAKQAIRELVKESTVETIYIPVFDEDGVPALPTDEDYVFQTKEESEKIQRRVAILSVLSLGGNSVNDIKRKFPKYSPKTLQRDINDMIEEKKVVRIGEKRWAKYYLK